MDSGMRNRLIYGLLFFPVLLLAQGPDTLRVMSFNVRYDNPGDGPHQWKYRKSAAAALIRDYDADIVGTQEVLHHQLEDLRSQLPNYAHVGVGRADAQQGGEYSAVLYRHDRFALLDQGTFWLSETPERIASVGWDASMERIASWGILEHRVSGRRYAVFNTHFDHRGEQARRESAALLLQKISAIAGDLPVILSGDFNAAPDSAPITLLRAPKSGLLDVSTVPIPRKGPEWTFHDFGRLPLEQRPQIDYIFVSPGFRADQYQVIFEAVGQTFHSDHNPVWVRLSYGH
jgi:endonuclease/exonuclease/phosphatase family metal-dependent hydrolase